MTKESPHNINYNLKKSLTINDYISPGDRMFAGDRDHYLAVGQSALDCISVSMLAAKIETFTDILDMASGHGRVLRYLHAAFPEARLTACDVETEAVDFCAHTFGATPVYAEELPNDTALPGTYDLIYVGSLLTHLNEKRCIEFLDFFRKALRKNGLLLFTMHGRFVARRMRESTATYGLRAEAIPGLLHDYETNGFGYVNYPTEAKFGVFDNYGISVVSPRWVFAKLEKLEDIRLVNFTESGWDNHQDVVACLRA